jgi:hypothetical protein
MSKFWLLLFCIVIPAQTRQLDFLLLWPGARATALAGAFTARADDPTAAYYNPAGLAFLPGERFSFTHAHLLPIGYQGTFHEFLGFTERLTDQFGIGLSGLLFIRGRTPPFQPDLNLNYVGFDAAVGPSFGVKLSRRLALGGAIRYIYSLNIEENFQETKGTSIGFDLTLYYKPIPRLSIGGALRNLGPTIHYIGRDEEAQLPKMGRLGADYQLLKSRWGIRVGGEVTKLFAEAGLWRSFSSELSYRELLFLWGGWLKDAGRDRNGFTFGVGIKTKRFELDLGTDERVYSHPRSDLKLTISYKTD